MLTYEEQLEAVRHDGLYLKHIEDQTDELCKLAVQQNGMSLRYVKEQTPELCKLAVQQNKIAVKYIVTISTSLQLWLFDNHIYDRIDYINKIIYGRLYDQSFCISVCWQLYWNKANGSAS